MSAWPQCQNSCQKSQIFKIGEYGGLMFVDICLGFSIIDLAYTNKKNWIDLQKEKKSWFWDGRREENNFVKYDELTCNIGYRSDIIYENSLVFSLKFKN
jgi:hypothetical protein